MEAQADKQQLLDLVHSFTAAWNEAEGEVYRRDEARRAARPVFTSAEEQADWRRTHESEDLFEVFAAQANPLFDAYCTRRERVYGGKNPPSFGWPTKYHGAETPQTQSVQLKNKNRAEVTLVTGNDFQDEYLFVVLRKEGEWRIDSYKYRQYGKDKWRVGIL